MDILKLEPYSSEVLMFIKGCDYDEVVAWFKEHCSKTPEKKLSKIKHHYAWYEEYLDFFSKIKEEINTANEGKSTVVGHYLSKELKCEPGNKIRLILLRDDWEPSSPNHMITLAHEVLHLCQEFLPNFLNRDEEHEAEAYFHTYIMHWVVKLFD